MLLHSSAGFAVLVYRFTMKGSLVAEIVSVGGGS